MHVRVFVDSSLEYDHLIASPFFHRLTCLERKGQIVPGIIRINAVCVESESLMSDSAVMEDDVTLGLRIAEFINEYQVTRQDFAFCVEQKDEFLL